MRAVSAASSPRPAYSIDSHSSVVTDVDSSFEIVVEVPFDDDLKGKNIAVCTSDLQTYRREKVWHINFQVEEAQNPLRAVSQEHDDDFLELTQSIKYHHGAGLMTVASVCASEMLF